MNQQTLYHLSCRAAQELLDGMDSGNFDTVDDRLSKIRHYVALAEVASPESLRGDALLHREQIEALGGVVEGLAGTLRLIRRKIACEVDTLRAGRDLLRHLVTPTLAPQSRGAGCTSRVSPIA